MLIERTPTVNTAADDQVSDAVKSLLQTFAAEGICIESIEANWAFHRMGGAPDGMLMLDLSIKRRVVA